MPYKLIIIFAFKLLICDCRHSFDFEVKGNSAHGYYITSFIGTPPQRVNLLVDTGSSNLAVSVMRLPHNDSRYFAYNESSTFHPSSTGVQLRYVQGYWIGFLGVDVFHPCPEEDCTVICNISCMFSTKNIFDYNSEFQGIIGLAYPSISVPDSSVRPFLDVFVKEKNISDIFALHLCGPFFSSEKQSSSCGKLHVGSYSADSVDSDVLYTPVVHEWFYEITVINIKVNEVSIPTACEELNRNKSIIDSGTTNLKLPEIAYSWVMSNIKGHVSYSMPDYFWLNETVVCSMNKSIDISLLPVLTLSLYHSHSKFFNLLVSPELYMLPLSHKSCAMLAIGTSEYGVMIGSSILKGFYVIFDRGNKRVGFAKPKTFDEAIDFVNEVSGLEMHYTDLEHCIRKDKLDSVLPTSLGLMLMCLIFIALCVLLPLTTWLWKFHVKKTKEDKPDAINLVEDE